MRKVTPTLGRLKTFVQPKYVRGTSKLEPLPIQLRLLWTCCETFIGLHGLRFGRLNFFSCGILKSRVFSGRDNHFTTRDAAEYCLIVSHVEKCIALEEGHLKDIVSKK
jgi:hypothetical protein